MQLFAKFKKNYMKGDQSHLNFSVFPTSLSSTFIIPPPPPPPSPYGNKAYNQRTGWLSRYTHSYLRNTSIWDSWNLNLAPKASGTVRLNAPPKGVCSNSTALWLLFALGCLATLPFSMNAITVTQLQRSKELYYPVLQYKVQECKVDVIVVCQ